MNHDGRSHALLGASSAERWMTCPGSVRLSEGRRNPPNRYMAEGTAAHELAEWVLREPHRAPEDRIGHTLLVGDQEIEIDDEMAAAVRMYTDAIRGPEGLMLPDDTLMIEQRFDLGALREGMFGTADACILSPSRRELIVTDFKYGKGRAVEAVGNPQLRYYGLGALHAVAEQSVMSAATIERLRLVIVQPRAPHRHGPIREETLDIMDLLEWRHDLLMAAQATDDPNAPLVPGEHCGFCPAAGVCPALRDRAIAAAMADFQETHVSLPPDPYRLDPEQLARVLDMADVIDTWIAAVRSHALHMAESGETIPGYKLVDKRPTRRWKDEGEAIQTLLALGAAHDADELYTRKLKSPAQAEKLLPKHRRAEIEPLVERVSSGRNLVRENDPRPAREASAVADFSGLG